MAETPATPTSEKGAGRKPQVKTNSWHDDFIEGMARMGNVSLVCRRIGVDRKTVYQARERLPEFRARWEEAKAEATELLEGEARRRALTGVKRDILYQGQKVGEETVYSDVLLIFLLKALKPEMYRERYDLRQTVEVTGKARDNLDEEIRQLMDELQANDPPVEKAPVKKTTRKPRG